MFSRERIEQFISLHNGREGISVLGFKSIRKGTLSNLFARYSEKHPNLVASDGLVKLPNGGDMLEVYAYYQKGSQDADRGTVLRFFEGCESLPGFSTVEAKFPSNATPIYFDHWVSNVFDRKLFISTLKDTLGFEPKVDFNAGKKNIPHETFSEFLKGISDHILDHELIFHKLHQSQVHFVQEKNG